MRTSEFSLEWNNSRSIVLATLRAPSVYYLKFQKTVEYIMGIGEGTTRNDNYSRNSAGKVSRSSLTRLISSILPSLSLTLFLSRSIRSWRSGASSNIYICIPSDESKRIRVCVCVLRVYFFYFPIEAWHEMRIDGRMGRGCATTTTIF